MMAILFTFHLFCTTCNYASVRPFTWKKPTSYAVEQQLPPLYIQCEPKIENHEKAKDIIKALFQHIEKNFRQINKNFKQPFGFDYWFINKEGHLICYTRHIELFIYLSEPNHYPSKINDINIIANKPKHLPTQNTLILKFIPNYISSEEVQNELNIHFTSIYNIEDMKGSKTEKYRHMRVEFKSIFEYEQILKNRGITIDGLVIEAEEFLAPPKLLMCSKCNNPGHMRKSCTSKYEACRRCGNDRSIGEHKECTISCHRCQQDHLSTDYKCQFLINYRRQLIN